MILRGQHTIQCSATIDAPASVGELGPHLISHGAGKCGIGDRVVHKHMSKCRILPTLGGQRIE